MPLTKIAGSVAVSRTSLLLLWSQASFAETVTDVSCYAEIKGEMVTLDGICIDRLRSPELTGRAMGR